MTQLKNFGCFFIDNYTKIEPVFFIKANLWEKYLSVNGHGNQKILQSMTQEEYNDAYIVKIMCKEIQFVPISSETLLEMISNSYLVDDNFSPKKFADIFNKKYPHVTEKYMREALMIVNQELENIAFTIEKHKILEIIKNDQTISSDISSDSSSSSDVD